MPEPRPQDRMNGDRRTCVLHVVGEYLPRSEAFTGNLLRAMQEDVRQAVVALRTNRSTDLPLDRIEIVAWRDLLRPACAREAADRLREQIRPEVLHAHHGYAAGAMLMLKHFLGVPMVVTFGGRDLWVEASWPAAGRLYEDLFRTADQSVTVCEDLRERALELGCPVDDITTVHRGVSAEEFPFIDRADHGAEPVRLLMVGRLVAKKGHRDALNALASLRPGLPPWRMDVIGDGPERRGLVRLARGLALNDRVRFVGGRSREEVCVHMTAADVLLQPSITAADGDREGVPNALLEGMATGLPVVATRHGGMAEVVQDGRTGLLVPEGDPAALAEALAELLADARRRLSMGRAGAERIRSDFTMARQVEAYLAIYDRLVRDGAAGQRAVRAPSGGLPALLRAARLEGLRMGERRPGLRGWARRAAYRCVSPLYNWRLRRQGRVDDREWRELASRTDDPPGG